MTTVRLQRYFSKVEAGTGSLDEIRVMLPEGEVDVMNFGRPIGPSGRGPLDPRTTPRRSQSFDLTVDCESKAFVFFAISEEQSNFFVLILMQVY